jgi:Ca2+/Na+ antiporter
MNLKSPALILLFSLIAHSHFKAINIGEALAISALCVLYGYTLFLDSKREAPINEEVKKELQELRSAVSALKVARAYGR